MSHSRDTITFKDVMDKAKNYIKDENELNNIINPNINGSKDDCRIYYVALSRAKDFMCISVPSLSKEVKARLVELGMKVIEIWCKCSSTQTASIIYIWIYILIR